MIKSVYIAVFMVAFTAHAETPKYFGKFQELPMGAVQPRGWIKNWLENQASGLTGHPENLGYPYDTCLYSGHIPPPLHPNKYWKEWWPYEQAAYFVDATTRLSWLINDPSIAARRDANLNYILTNSTGTNYGNSKAGWPNAVVGRALMAQYSATGDARIASVMTNWLLTSAPEIAKGARAGVNLEQAFYLYGLTGDQRLLDLCKKIYGVYLHDSNSFCTIEKIEGKNQFHEHGVTAAEELKCLPLMYSYTGDPESLRLANLAYKKVLDNNLMADGGIVSAEHLAPTAFYSVHESCDLTDWSWSVGYLFMATGEPRYADLIERTTFNALAGAVTKDFKQLQYFSGVNQLNIGVTNTHTPPWPTRMAYRAAHDVECCSGNINRAMPNYVSRMWMRPDENGLAAVYYGPCEVTTTVAGQKITIIEETDYPFRAHIQFRIKTSKPVTFQFQCRIPEWCDEGTLGVNGQEKREFQKPGSFASLQREFRNGDVLTLHLPMPIRTEDWFKNRSVSVTRGPLVYSLKIADQRVEHTDDSPEIKAMMNDHDIRQFPEVEFYAASEWRYGLPVDIKNHLSRIKVVESSMTPNPFAHPPVRLEVPMQKIPRWNTGLSEPTGLPNEEQARTRGELAPMTFVPYGATHLRLTSIPVLPNRPQ